MTARNILEPSANFPGGLLITSAYPMGSALFPDPSFPALLHRQVVHIDGPMAIMEPLNRIQNKKRHSKLPCRSSRSSRRNSLLTIAKPCKFYQMNNCPYPQEECDFAHILTGEPTFQNATPCRFYIKGHCSNGLWCRYKHSLERGSDSG